MTTTFKRAGYAAFAVRSISEQEYKPDKIIINISSESYLQDEGFGNKILKINDGLCDVHMVKNIGSYRKLLPIIFDECDDTIIVTADDDVIYHPKWLKNLMLRYFEYPNHIVCGMARRIKKIFMVWSAVMIIGR